VRKSLVALAVVLVAGLGAVIPATAPVAHAASTTKVAIIVGATHGTTSTYRSYADSIAAAARRYTSNVVKVYSPNATWSKAEPVHLRPQLHDERRLRAQLRRQP
jgi:hypothetical protein